TVPSLAQAVVNEPRTRAVVEGYLRYGEGRPALVFAVSVEHAQQISQALGAAGVPAAAVIGEMGKGERAQVLADFRSGSLQALVSCEVLTEGYDERRVSCVVMARPTKSEALYTQCVGRGLRTDPDRGKEDCLVLDVVDRASKHAVIVASQLFGPRVRDCRGEDIRDAARREAARRALETVSPTVAQAARWEMGQET